MRNRQSGFTLLELIIVMAIFTTVIISASEMFVTLLSEFKQQGKIAITNIEGILGLEMMRRDIEHAGYGLPWDGITGYSEIPASANALAASLNDASPSAPRAILSKDNDAAAWHTTDYLAIKATNVAMSNTCEKWTLLDKANNPTPWPSAMDDLKSDDNVILISQGPTSRTLVSLTSGPNVGGFTTTKAHLSDYDANRSDTSIVYGIDPNTSPKMPFNRTDYYVAPPASASDMPFHCADGTGLLYKAVATQVDDPDTAYQTVVPVLDCVADMQVSYVRLVDTDGDGVPDKDYTSNIAAYDAEQIRTQVREVRVYILAQEGQRDRGYTSPDRTVCVGEKTGTACLYGRNFDFEDPEHLIPEWKNYRWKLYTLVVNPINLR